MTKKHFKHAAEIVRTTSPGHQITVCNAFIELFERFAPRFDRARFVEECGL